MAGHDRRVLRKLEVRERLMAMLQKATMAHSTQDERELQRLRDYLLEWASVQKDKDMGLGVSMSRALQSSGSKDATELFAESDGWAMVIVSTAVEDLRSIKPDGFDLYAALRCRYLNEGLSREAGMSVRVFRHNRLKALSLIEVDKLADRAELALLPIVKKRHLPL